MDNFSKFTNDELTIEDIGSIDNDSVISKSVNSDINYDTSLLGNPCTQSEKTNSIIIGAACGTAVGVGVAYTMAKYHKTILDGLKLVGTIFHNLPF